jgi:hypothetical protein
MSVALAARSTVLLSYLAALVTQGRLDLSTGLLAGAVIALWALALLRDRRGAPMAGRQPAAAGVARALSGTPRLRDRAAGRHS